VITTDTLFGKDWSGTWHCVGGELIEINLLEKGPTSAIRWKNLTHQIGGMQGPPNIGADGRVTCFGDAAGMLHVAFEKEDWETIVAIAVRYPECAGSQNQITRWPEFATESVPSWYLETFIKDPEVPKPSGFMVY
jgi:hypothetical protein